MPELPEVETIRRGLAQHILGKEITHIEVRLPKMIKTDQTEFTRTLQGNAFHSIDRQGKLLIFHLEQHSELALLLHLKMTGQLIYRHGSEQVAGGHPWPPYNDELPNKYSHIIFTFATGAHLYFNDQRQFGYLKLVEQEDVQKEKEKYGIEPHTDNFTRTAFRKLFTNRHTQLKSLLLNQSIISGIGNIYADEICFYAGIKPHRTVDTLTPLEINTLFDGCLTVIGTAIQHRGTTISDFTDANGQRGNYSDYLHVYGREGQSCHRCAGTITKTKVAGRGTHWCPDCQK